MPGRTRPDYLPRWITLLCVVIGAATLRAAEPQPAGSAAEDTSGNRSAERSRLTLADAERLALARNADLRVAEAAARAAFAQVRAAHEFPNPTLALSVAKINTDGSGNGTPAGNRFFDRSYDSIAALNQLFELGKRGPRQSSAAASHRAAEAQRDDVRRLLLQSVSQAYVTAVEANDEVRVLEDSAASLRREADVAARRLQAGDISAADKAQIEIAADRFALDAAAARHTATVATITLETLLGEPNPSGQLELVDTLATVTGAQHPELFEATPLGSRPDVAAAEASVEKADADLTLARRGRIPDLTISGQFERNPPDAPNSAGVGVSLPLPLWNRNGGNILAARAAREQAEAQFEKARLQAAADIVQARSAAREAHERAEAYATRLLPKSADVVRTVTYAYEHGGASLLDLLVAQRNDNDLRLAAARAQADYANAMAALAAALNRSTTPTS
jgi:cobalt-zinc-cadmium efflux system outer membrane protein